MAAPLTPEEVARVKEAFDNLDASGSGSITHDDLKTLLSNAQIEVTDDQISELIGALDTDNTGSISWDNFLAFWETRPARQRVAERLLYFFHNVFQAFDTDGSGYVTVDDLKTICKEAGISDQVSDEDLEAVIAGLDPNGDGKVSFEDFINAIIEG